MSFSDQSIHQRIAGLAGGPAETAFVEAMARKGHVLGQRLFRFGIEQLTTNGGPVATMSPLVRRAPDFVQAGGHMWEVQGCGKDLTFKFKTEKMLALAAWQRLLADDNRDLRWGLYVMPEQVVYLASWEHVLWACQQKGEWREQLLDDKSGWAVPADAFRYGTVVDLSAALRAGRGYQ